MKRWQEISCWALGTAGIMYGMIYCDVIWRAKQAYDQGEKYWQWSDHPEVKAQFYNARLAHEKSKLDAQLTKGKLSKEEYDRSVDLAQFDHDQALQESSIKYAYVWYQTASELFSPPNSKWVQLARQKMPLAKERWKSELHAKGVPFEEYMID